MARSLNYYCSENATVSSPVLLSCTSLYHQYSSTKCCTKMLLWRIMSPVTIKRAYVFTYNVQYSLRLSQIRSFWTDFHKSPISYFKVNRSVGAALIHADRRTDIMKLVGTFCFMRTSLKEYAIHCIIQKLLNADTKGKNSSVVIGKTI
jgi:hypothetical protein